MNAGNSSTPPIGENFLIQDPDGIRSVVQPVVAINQKKDEIIGLGTCFQISPWRWLTAQHVVQHSDENMFPDETVAAVGFSFGSVYGRVSFVTTDYFGEIRELLKFASPTATEKLLPFEPKLSTFLIDASSLLVDISRLKSQRMVSPLPISTTSPKIGDQVLALGYPILGSQLKPASDGIVFEERLFGGPGVVVELLPNGQSSLKPWPTFRIEGDWPSGMSGGPVISQNGHVVGVVSSSFEPTDRHPGIGYAVDLSKIPLNLIAPELNLLNPGYVSGFGVFLGGVLIQFFPDLNSANYFSKQEYGCVVQKISLNPKTEEYMHA